MSLTNQVSLIIGGHTLQLSNLLQFVRDTSNYIATLKPLVPSAIEKAPEETRAEFKQYFKEFADFFTLALSEAQKPSPKKGERTWHFQPSKSHPEFDEHLIAFLKAIAKPIEYPQFLYNMALTHSIGIFESFLNDFLLAILIQKPDTLKSQNMASYEEILSFKSMKQLTRHLADSKVNKILSDNIDNVMSQLKNLFSYNISEFNEFHIIREASYRRNVILHNNCVTDKKYCEKIPDSKIDIYLQIDLQYIETLVNTLGKFIDCLDKHFSKKMRYKRNPYANALIYPRQNKQKGTDL